VKRGFTGTIEHRFSNAVDQSERAKYLGYFVKRVKAHANPATAPVAIAVKVCLIKLPENE